ncbi:invasion associated locus B family protein [Pelagibacterium montanilacus]|uniref:invasion associated locus B family protein n=1 Tax=Pelagibacterium montanilacus TaxID=2185280 RepID=UPI000F8E1BD2|nr:invasion associated locus B family protein [Pelagibacterium montanilacus]
MAISRAQLKTLPALLVAGCALMAIPAAAQSVRILGDHSAWSAYAAGEGTGQVCFSLSRPTATEPVPEGFTEAYFYITHRPAESVREEINLVAGYQFAADSTATLAVGDQSFALYTRGDAAWMADTGLSDQAAAAIRAGATMTITGTSDRGVSVRQTFSLAGATAASGDINEAC